jgi:hypothetical protein
LRDGTRGCLGGAVTGGSLYERIPQAPWRGSLFRLARERRTLGDTRTGYPHSGREGLYDASAVATGRGRKQALRRACAADSRRGFAASSSRSSPAASQGPPAKRLRQATLAGSSAFRSTPCAPRRSPYGCDGHRQNGSSWDLSRVGWRDRGDRGGEESRRWRSQKRFFLGFVKDRMAGSGRSGGGEEFGDNCEADGRE